MLLLGVFLVAPTHAAKPPTPDDYGAPASGSVRIMRDRYGVPHVIAQNNVDMCYGIGYAQAEDQLANIARNYLISEGRGAEFLGKEQVPIDHMVRALNLPRLARNAFADLRPEIRSMLVAFSDGINAFANEHPAQVPDWVEPAEPHDSIALGLFANSMFVLSHCRNDLNRAGIKIAEWQPNLRLDSLLGSNHFAIGPSRSATGAAMLSIDPHLQHSGIQRWYEFHHVSSEMNAMGAAFFGVPIVTMGRTFDIAWGNTNNYPDLGDVFAHKIKPDMPTRYLGDNGWQDFDVRREEFRFRTKDGTSSLTQAVMRSKFGPVVTVKDGIAYSFKMPIPSGAAMMEQSYLMLKAKNMSQFRDALRKRGGSMWNYMYADRHGDTFYISNGLVPLRDNRISSHAVRPAEEAWSRWKGIHKFEDLPQLENPESGYMLNTNSGAHNVTTRNDIKRSDFPEYMIQQDHNSRSRRLTSLLENDPQITWDEMLAYAADTKLEADQMLKTIGNLLGGSSDEKVGAVLAVLEDWDQRTDLESRGAILFLHLVANEDFRTALESNHLGIAESAVKQVVASITERFGSIDAPWKEFSRIRRGDKEMGIAGMGNVPGAPVGAALRPTFGSLSEGRQYCTGGSSYMMIVDFSGDSKAVSCLPFGVSEHRESPHFADMLPLYAAGKFKPAWFLPTEVAENRISDVVIRRKSPRR